MGHSCWWYSCAVLPIVLLVHLQRQQSKISAWSPLIVGTTRNRRRRVAVNNRKTITSCQVVEDGDTYCDDDDKEDGETLAKPQQHFLMDSLSSGFYYDERRPIRHPNKTSRTTPPADFDAMQRSKSYDGRNALIPDVVRDPSPPTFPSTIDALTEHAARQILHLCSSENQETRIGLQIEGLEYLQHPPSGSSGAILRSRHGSRSREYAAMRHLALLLAGKLSSFASVPLPNDSVNDNVNNDSSLSSNKKLMPISIYWNTVKQALVASQELLFLKRIEKHQQNTNNPQTSVYDRIQIRCLMGDHPMIPPDMLLQDQSIHRRGTKQQPSRQQRNHAKNQNQLRRQRGIILVMQPTDYNDLYEPPGPAINVWTALQELVASAAVEDLPVVCVSPRYLLDTPAPWVLRDFASPVLSWTVRVDEQPVAVWHSATASTTAKTELASTGAEDSRWHVFGVNGNDRLRSFPYLASCRDEPTDQKLRHLVNEYNINVP